MKTVTVKLVPSSSSYDQPPILTIAEGDFEIVYLSKYEIYAYFIGPRIPLEALHKYRYRSVYAHALTSDSYPGLFFVRVECLP